MLSASLNKTLPSFLPSHSTYTALAENKQDMPMCVLTDVFVPRHVELGVVCQAALHGVQAVVVARLGLREAAAVGAVHHPHQRPGTLLRAGNLEFK